MQPWDYYNPLLSEAAGAWQLHYPTQKTMHDSVQLHLDVHDSLSVFRLVSQERGWL